MSDWDAIPFKRNDVSPGVPGGILRSANGPSMSGHFDLITMYSLCGVDSQLINNIVTLTFEEWVWLDGRYNTGSWCSTTCTHLTSPVTHIDAIINASGDIDEYTAAFNVVPTLATTAFRRGLNHPAFTLAVLTPCHIHELAEIEVPHLTRSHLYHYRWNNAKATMTYYQVAHRYHDNVHMSPSVVTQSLSGNQNRLFKGVIVRS